jgi:hypothetical protein
VLEQLLSEWRSMSDSGQASTGIVVSSSSNSTLPVLQCCEFLLDMLTAASVLAPHTKPLQDCVRMVAQAAAAAATADPFTRRQQLHYAASIANARRGLSAAASLRMMISQNHLAFQRTT